MVSRPNLQNDVCYGTLLSREQYLHDLEHLKDRDSREEPEGPMSREHIGDSDGGHSRAAGTARAGGPVSAAGPGRAGSAGRADPGNEV